MRIMVRSFQAPRWVVPVLFVAALAILPFALLFGLVILGLVLGGSLIRLFLPGSPSPSVNVKSQNASGYLRSSVIDADYEIKDENHEEGKS
jgi:hypothetical protein